MTDWGGRQGNVLGAVSYGYDALERLSSVTGPAGQTQVE